MCTYNDSVLNQPSGRPASRRWALERKGGTKMPALLLGSRQLRNAARFPKGPSEVLLYQNFMTTLRSGEVVKSQLFTPRTHFCIQRFDQLSGRVKLGGHRGFWGWQASQNQVPADTKAKLCSYLLLPSGPNRGPKNGVAIETQQHIWDRCPG